MARPEHGHESPTPSEAELRLSDVALDEPVEVVEVALPMSEAEPLFDRGLLPGAIIRTVRRSPFGDPIVRVCGTLLALRRETAAGLRVKRLPASG